MAKATLTKRRTTTSVSDAEALHIVMQLMAIPGRSGEETAIMDFIRDELIEAGAPKSLLAMDDAHRRSPIGGSVGNMTLKLPGTTRGPRRMLSAHVDTVPICIGSRPTRKGSRIVSANKKTGLGGDDRSGAAIILTTALTILRAKLPHPPLTFLWIVQEEAGLLGARYMRVSKLGKPKLAFNFDGGAPHTLKIGATGGYRMAIEIHGLAAHAGNHPEEGVSAIAIASIAIADLTDRGWHGLIEKDGHTGTSNFGVIQGGEATNVVTDYVKLRVEARSHEPEFRDAIVKEIRSAFESAADRVLNTAEKSGRVEFDGRLDYEAFRLALDEPSVIAAAAAVKAECGELDMAVTNGGLDANWLTAHGIPTVTLGCGQRNIHTRAEELDIAEFHAARRIALRLATANHSR
jgi:tripeptide aminopeptidase